LNSQIEILMNGGKITTMISTELIMACVYINITCAEGTKHYDCSRSLASNANSNCYIAFLTSIKNKNTDYPLTSDTLKQKTWQRAHLSTSMSTPNPIIF
jgi:hypothetical protein